MMNNAEEEVLQEQSSDPQAREFLALLAAMPWLLRQIFADGVNLLETESRLAMRSLIMLLALALCLAVLLGGAWLLLMVFAVYAAIQAEIAGWIIALGVVLLHLLLLAGLAQQMKALARCLTFPNSRRALANLIAPSPPPEL